MLNKNPYKKQNGKRLIELSLKSPLQLFDIRDPSPFREKDLDSGFVEYITSAAKELKASKNLKLLIYIEEPEKESLGEFSIATAIQDFFSYHQELMKTELSDYLKRAQVFFLLGLLVLFTSLSIAYSISYNPLNPGLNIIREGIIIIGWVSMWKPMELILFDWLPLYEKMNFYKKLSKMEVETKFNIKK